MYLSMHAHLKGGGEGGDISLMFGYMFGFFTR